MPEENKINQGVPQPGAVEDVFSNVDEVNTTPTPTTPQAEIPAEAVSEEISPEQKTDSVGELRADNPQEEKGRGINSGKILFYVILGLIILLGVFAIWALLF